MNPTAYMQTRTVSASRLVKLCGVAATGISRMLTDTRQSVSPETAAKISAATKGIVSIEEILFPGGIPRGARMSARKEKADV